MAEIKDVEVPFGEKSADDAVLLLEAAEKIYDDQSVVRTVTGAFLVPEDVAKKAGVKYDKPDSSEAEAEPESTSAKKSTSARK